MGEVYRARDAKLEREVAIKVLPQHLTADADALARFEREAKAVAALSHPNILAIHDFGSQDGVTYAVTELLEGETLRGKLDAVNAVSQAQAVNWAEQIAKGLAAAHSKGVVHRDLKPENVFVTRDGHVKILDFGLAKRAEAVSEQTNAPTGTGHTAPGTVMGTVGYMSPEQVRGLPVDHRSDIFSLGAILYELLSGKKAFKRDTASDTMASIMRDEPAELSQSGRSIPVTLDHIVRHCLEKDRDARFQSARDIAFALSEASGATSAVTSGSQASAAAPAARGKTGLWIAVAAAVVLLAAAGILLSRRTKTGSSAPGGVKRMVVLPFENLGAPEDDYFADGIADEIRGKLTSLPGIQVIARGSSTPYKKTNKTPRQIAEELDVQYLLTATVRTEKTGGTSRVHVSPELVDVSQPSAPTSKWQQPFDASMTDVFQVQSDIAARVAQALGVALGAGEQKQLADRPTKSLPAYEAFLKGEEVASALTKNDPATLRKALGFYDQAVALDPGFAGAWARIAIANALLYTNSTPVPEVSQRAQQAAEKAISLAPNDPWPYEAMGTYKRLVLVDYQAAREDYAKGRSVSPGNSELTRAMGTVEIGLGNWDAALARFQEAERLDPRSISVHLWMGRALLGLRRYPEARQAIDVGLVLSPDNLDLIEQRTMSFLGEGNLAGAKAHLAALPPTVNPAELVAYLTNYQDLGWVLTDEQREILLRLTPTAFDDDRGTWAMCQTQVLWWKGDTAGARKHAEEARQVMEEQLRVAPNDPGRHSSLGLALGYLGRGEEAIREGRRAVEIDPVTKDATNGQYLLHQLVRIEVLAGQHDKALDDLEQLLKLHYVVSAAWLKIDPNFDPLRKNPRFEKLVAGAK
jgi:TolB-like protein/Flp pilus assembly protein TadD